MGVSMGTETFVEDHALDKGGGGPCAPICAFSRKGTRRSPLIRPISSGGDVYCLGHGRPGYHNHDHNWILGRVLQLPDAADGAAFSSRRCPIGELMLAPHQRAVAGQSIKAGGFELAPSVHRRPYNLCDRKYLRSLPSRFG